jgi:hypothetical protein
VIMRPAQVIHLGRPLSEMLKAGVTQATIWQRLRDERDLLASLASLKRWVAANLPEEVRRDRVTLR